MLPYHNDPTIKFSHSPVIQKIAFQANQIGPDNPYVFPVVDYEDTDDNTIYVNSESPGDDSNPGTYSSPKATLLAAINATTAVKTRVVVQDIATIFNEDISGGTYTYFQGVYQETTGGSSSWVGRLLGFVPSDSNAIFVRKTGADDSSADGTQAAPYLTINYAKDFCDTGRDVIVIMDSETYQEEGFEFTGNFTGIYAAIGEAPTVEVGYDDDEYFEGTEIVGDTNLVAYYILHRCALRLPDNRILLVFQSQTAGRGQYMILNSDYSVSVAATNLTSGSTALSGADMCFLQSGSIMLVYTIGGIAYYEIRSATDFSVQAGPTSYVDFQVTFVSVSQFEDGKIFLGYQDYTDSQYGKFQIWSSSYQVLVGETTFNADRTEHIASTALPNGYVMLIYQDWNEATDEGYYIIYDSSGNQIVSPTLYCTGTNAWQKIMMLSTGYIMITQIGFRDAVQFSEYIILNSDDYSVFAQKPWTDAPSTKILGFPVELSNEQVVMFFNYNNTNIYYKVLSFDITLIKVSTEVFINGITIEAGFYDYIRYLFRCTDNIYISHSELNAASATSNAGCISVSSDSHVDITNSIIRDSDIGVDTTEDTSDFIDSQFYRISEGYAIDVNGAAGTGAGINIDHCDLFDCYGGVRLQNNDGGEEIKNSIFHDLSVFAIYADDAITLNNSIYTDSTSGVTIGSYVVRANPDYVNEGYINPDDTDLNIRTKVLGYPANSPAYDLADDDRNAGAIDVKYIGTETTYTTITLPKSDIMKIYRQYSGAANTQRKDGSYSSYKDGQSEIAEMTWTGLSAAYMTLLLIMWQASDSNVLIYPDPETYPNNFEQWTLLREPVNVGTDTPTLSDLGAQGVTLKFARAVE